MNRLVTLGTMVATLCVSSIVTANDARSIAMGGAVIANGQGVHGANANPATLMQMHRRGEKTHVTLAFSTETRASSDLVDFIEDEQNETIFEELEDEIDALNILSVSCNPIVDPDETPCIVNTDPISVLSGRILDFLNILDDSVDARVQANLGVAITGSELAYGFNIRASGTGIAAPNVAAGDKAYIGQFVNLLAGDLTLGEIKLDEAPDYITFDSATNTVDVVLPDENDPVTGEPVLNSSGEIAAIARAQFGVSFARTMMVAGYQVDLGVTPKFSNLQASDVFGNVQDEFDDNSQSLEDQFEDNEVSESSFTVDVGMVTDLPNQPFQVAAVVRNLIPESITTKNGYKFETTPQLIVGAGYRKGKFNASADLALNSAKIDNFDTQKIGVGVEYGSRWYALRAGISHDTERNDDATALSLGFGLAALNVGVRGSSKESIEASAQLSFSFN